MNRSQVGSDGNRDAAIVERLLTLWDQIPREKQETLLVPGLATEAHELVRTNPFAFLLAASLDRGTKAEIIWTLPYWLKQALGHLDPCRIARMSEGDIRAVLERLPKKPRYINDCSPHHRVIGTDGVRRVSRRRHAVVGWENRP
jgi:hypothetical protein